MVQFAAYKEVINIIPASDMNRSWRLMKQMDFRFPGRIHISVQQKWKSKLNLAFDKSNFHSEPFLLLFYQPNVVSLLFLTFVEMFLKWRYYITSGFFFFLFFLPLLSHINYLDKCSEAFTFQSVLRFLKTALIFHKHSILPFHLCELHDFTYRPFIMVWYLISVRKLPLGHLHWNPSKWQCYVCFTPRITNGFVNAGDLMLLVHWRRGGSK